MKAPHGTRRRYQSLTCPCHCEACRAANAAYIARQRGSITPAPSWGTHPARNGDKEPEHTLARGELLAFRERLVS